MTTISSVSERKHFMYDIKKPGYNKESHGNESLINEKSLNAVNKCN